MRRLLLTCSLLAIVLVSVLAAPPTQACPNCKDSVGTSASESTGVGDANADVSSGFNASIYLMLTAFVGVLGLVSFTLYRGIRSGTPTASPVK